MPQSLRTVDFDYTEEREWRNYFNSRVADFVEEAKALHEFRQELVKKCAGKHFNELQEEWDYSQVLLGGVGEDGEYREKSLAKLYKDLFGLQFENLTEVVEKQRQNISPSTKIIVNETHFSAFVAEAVEKAEDVLQKAYENDITHNPNVVAEYDFYDLLSDQENLSRLLSEFLYRLQYLMPNYSKRALFLWTLPKTTNRYLSVAYPKLKERESWELLDNKLGIEPVFMPDINETGNIAEQREQQYTVYDYRDGSLGDLSIELYRLVWEAFDSEVEESLQLVFPDIPNFRQNFLDEAHEKLDQIGWNTPSRTTFELPGEEENLKIVGNDSKYSGNRGDLTEAKYRISGVVLDQYSYSGHNTSGNRTSGERECSLSLLKVLDELSPGLFLLNGLEYELQINQQSLEVKKL